MLKACTKPLRATQNGLTLGGPNSKSYGAGRSGRDCCQALHADAIVYEKRAGLPEASQAGAPTQMQCIWCLGTSEEPSYIQGQRTSISADTKGV